MNNQHYLRIARLFVSGLCLALALGASADSLFNAQEPRSGTLIARQPARFKVGDLITVLVREEITAAVLANTNTKKESDVDSNAPAASNNFLVGQKPTGNNILNPGELPNWLIETENETKNTGQTRRTSTLTTTVTCTVTQVLPNETIIIDGERQVSVNREDSTLVVHGIARAKDVSPANSIASTQLAQAQILLRGKGPLWNNQRRGLVTRFLDWFSPF